MTQFSFQVTENFSHMHRIWEAKFTLNWVLHLQLPAEGWDTLPTEQPIGFHFFKTTMYILTDDLNNCTELPKGVYGFTRNVYRISRHQHLSIIPAPLSQPVKSTYSGDGIQEKKNRFSWYSHFHDHHYKAGDANISFVRKCTELPGSTLYNSHSCLDLFPSLNDFT